MFSASGALCTLPITPTPRLGAWPLDPTDGKPFDSRYRLVMHALALAVCASILFLKLTPIAYDPYNDKALQLYGQKATTKQRKKRLIRHCYCSCCLGRDSATPAENDPKIHSTFATFLTNFDSERSFLHELSDENKLRSDWIVHGYFKFPIRCLGRCINLH